MKKVISLLLCLLMLAVLPLSANAMRIQHNVTALNAHRNLTNDNSMLIKNLEKLSSGYRINRAGDDAADLAISEKMRAQITGLGQTWASDIDSEWYYVYETEKETETSRNAQVWQGSYDEKMVREFTRQLLLRETLQDGEQLPDQDVNWDAIEKLATQSEQYLFSALYGQNNIPQGMFTGVRTDNTANGIGYEMNEDGRLAPSFQLTLSENRQIFVNDNPEVALVNTQGDVTFSEAGTVNIGVFDADGEVVDSFSIQVNEDGTLETAPYANRMILQLGDTGTFQVDFINNQSTAMESNTSVHDISIADEMMAYTKNNILISASQTMLSQANMVPQGVMELLQ